MIKYVSGNFFDYDADIMVNTVNCVGVMGAGVALAFKKRYPEMFHDYAEKCKAKQIKPGQPSVWTHDDIISKKLEIINFPTKNHWKNPSEYSYIEDGLRWLRSYLEDKRGLIVTLPALGCGHGGLEWNKVREIISKYLESSPASIFVFEPSDSINAGDTSDKNNDNEKKMKLIGIGTMKPSSKEYPSKLSKYIKKDLFFYPEGQSTFHYDFSIICSTSPSEEETLIISQFVDMCRTHKKSILFGASSFEKKLALSISRSGIKCGCFLPSGIYDSVNKIKSKSITDGPHLLSIGNPMGAFDKKEFLPSILGRIHLTEKSIFLTKKLLWLSRFNKVFKESLIDSYYYDWETLPIEDKLAAIKIGAKNLAANFLDNASTCDELFKQSEQ